MMAAAMDLPFRQLGYHARVVLHHGFSQPANHIRHRGPQSLRGQEARHSRHVVARCHQRRIHTPSRPESPSVRIVTLPQASAFLQPRGAKWSLHRLFLFLIAPLLCAQTATLSGRVTDQSGAVVPAAAIVATGPPEIRSGVIKATAGSDGAYSLTGLTPGAWKVSASAPQLALPQPAAITLRAGVNTLDLQLKIAASAQQVTVTDSGAPAISTESSNNAGATIIKGDDLDALSDDPEDLAADLAALAGPSAGPGGASIFVDGFSGGQLPPKESIREIRINSNPFSPEYDKLGYGRIEIFTKPGSDKFHGSVGYNLGTARWNSRNPYSAAKAPFLLQETENSVSGPLTGHSSFTLDFERQAVDNGSIANGEMLDSSLNPVPFSSVLKTPQRHTLIGPHADYQLNATNTLSVRYLYTRADIRDGGIGSFDLISRGEHILNTFNTFQAIETSIHGNLVNETRFQYFRQANQLTANTLAPVIQVSGAFTGGGATVGQGADTQNNFELQNYTSIVHGRHFFRFGTRLRGQRDDNVSPSNFEGTFVFSGAPGVSSIEQYRRTLIYQTLGYSPAQIRALGGGATQFTIAGGLPEIAVHQFDGGFFFGDDWRLRGNLTLNLGLRYETQTNIRDAKDLAPRIAFAWAPGAASKPKTVIRGGFGIFYDRFSLGNTLTASRFNGQVQQQYVVINPDFFPTVPSPASLAGSRTARTVWEKDASLRAPLLMQSALTLERQLPKNSTLALTYTNSRGLHTLRSEDINPGFGNSPVLLMTSSAIYNQNLFIANVNSKVSSSLSLFGSYALSGAHSSSDGLSTFPANPYNYAGEYGRAAGDIRHRVQFGGTIVLRGNIRLNPLFTAQNSAPFNITTGEDNYGTTLFTARPGIATDPTRPGLVSTVYGLLDPNPTAAEKLLPRNSGNGPGMLMFNLRIGRTWGFGPEKGGVGDIRAARNAPAGGPALTAPRANGGMFGSPVTARRYNVTVAMSIRNLTNRFNQGPIVGNIASPLFGRSNQAPGNANAEGFSEAANNRRLELQLRFTY